MMPHARKIHLDDQLYYWQNHRNPWRIVIELPTSKFLTVQLKWTEASMDQLDLDMEATSITPRHVKSLLEAYLSNSLKIGMPLDTAYVVQTIK